MLIVADNLHVIHPVFAQALTDFKPEPIQKMVQQCLKAGAQAIDLNSGPLKKAPQKHFAFLVETVQEQTNLPLMLDTTNPLALEAGLQCCRQKAIINGFSLEPAKLEYILPLAKQYDTPIVGYLLDAKSRVPTDADALMALAVTLFETYISAGLDPEKLIIDPIVAPLSWDNGAKHNQAILSLIGHLSDLLGRPVKTIAGLSNLASGAMPKHRKIALEQTFLPILAHAGLDMVLLNVFHSPTVETASTCEMLLEDKVAAW